MNDLLKTMFYYSYNSVKDEQIQAIGDYYFNKFNKEGLDYDE